jgi:hypothetical protein
VPHGHEPFGAWIRKRFQQHAVDHAEDGGVGADADRQRHQCDAGERRTAAQGAQRIARIADHILEPGKPALIAQCFHRLRQAPGVDPCRPLGAIGRIASAACRVRRQREVRTQFVFEVAVDAPAAHGLPEPDNPFTPFAKCGHRTSSYSHRSASVGLMRDARLAGT